MRFCIRSITTVVAMIGLSSVTFAVQAQSSSEIRVGIDLTYPPYAFIENHVNSGFDVEMATLVGDVLGKPPVFIDTRFEQLIAGLGSQRYDAIIASLYITKERAEQVDYIPYFTTGTSIILRSGDDRQIVSEDDLCDLKISSIKGAAVVKILNEKVSKRCAELGKTLDAPKEFASDPEATLALISGNVDVQLTDAAVAQQAVERTNGAIKITNPDPLFPIPVGMAVRKGNAEMKALLTDALRKLEADGRYAKLLEKYNLKPADPEMVAAILR